MRAICFLLCVLISPSCFGGLILPKPSGDVILSIEPGEPTATLDDLFASLHSLGLSTDVNQSTLHNTTAIAPVIPLLADALGYDPEFNPVNNTNLFRFDLSDGHFRGIYNAGQTFGTTSIVGTEFHTPSAVNLHATAVPESSSLIYLAFAIFGLEAFHRCARCYWRS